MYYFLLLITLRVKLFLREGFTYTNRLFISFCGLITHRQTNKGLTMATLEKIAGYVLIVGALYVLSLFVALALVTILK